MIPDTSEAIGRAGCRFGIGYRPDLGVESGMGLRCQSKYPQASIT